MASMFPEEAFQKVYDEVMSTPQIHENDRACDVCDRPGPGKSMFLMPSDRKLNYDICETCRNEKKLEQVLAPVQANDNVDKKWNCDFCGTNLGGGCSWFASRTLDMDVCTTCYGHSDELLVTRRVTPEFRLAKRGLRLKFVDPRSIAYQHPRFLNVDFPSLHAITAERCDQWAAEWLDLVHVLDNFVWMEWARFADWHKMKHFPAWTSLAVCCNKAYPVQEKVAVLVKDEEGCIAIHIVYDMLYEFLLARRTFKERLNLQLPRAITLAQQVIEKSLEEGAPLDIQTLMICATEFSEYVCLEKEIPLTLRSCSN